MRHVSLRPNGHDLLPSQKCTVSFTGSEYTSAPIIAPKIASPCLRQNLDPSSALRIHGIHAVRVPAIEQYAPHFFMEWTAEFFPCYCTVTPKPTGAPGATEAVAVDPFGLDSVPSAICAVAANVCTPAFNVSNPLVPVIPVTAVFAPLGATIENNFTGVPPLVMS